MSEEVRTVEDIGREEADKVMAGKQAFGALVPYPDGAAVLTLKDAITKWGIEVGFDLSAAAGAIILSAVRVSTVMYQGAKLFSAGASDTILSIGPYIIGLSSMFAIEGLVASHGFKQGKEKGESEFGSMALWGSLLTMIAAGFISSMYIIPGLRGTPTEFWISLVMSSLISVVVVFNVHEGARMVGSVMFRLEQENLKLREKFQDELALWLGKFEKWYNINAPYLFEDGRVRMTGREHKGQAISLPAENLSMFKKVDGWLKQNGFVVADVGTHDGARITVKQLAEEIGITEEFYPDPAARSKAYNNLTRTMAGMRKRT